MSWIDVERRFEEDGLGGLLDGDLEQLLAHRLATGRASCAPPHREAAPVPARPARPASPAVAASAAPARRRGGPAADPSAPLAGASSAPWRQLPRAALLAHLLARPTIADAAHTRVPREAGEARADFLRRVYGPATEIEKPDPSGDYDSLIEYEVDEDDLERLVGWAEQRIADHVLLLAVLAGDADVRWDRTKQAPEFRRHDD